MNGAGAPEWVLWVGAAVGSMIAALVMRLGWKSAGGQKPSEAGKSVQIEGALVDSSSVIMLAGSIEALVKTLKEIEDRADKAGSVRAETLGKMMLSIDSLANSVNRWIKNHEEEEEKRLQRERDDAVRMAERLKERLAEMERQGR